MKKSLLLFCLAITTPLFAQWFWQNPKPQGNYLIGVDYVSTLTGWAVGGYGTILKTTDGGDNWLLQESGTKNHLWAVDFINENIGFVIGTRGTILKTTNGGNDWQDLVSPIMDSHGIIDVCFTDTNNGTAIGYMNSVGNDFIIRTTDGGMNWAVQFTAPAGEGFLGVYFRDSNYGWVVGFNGKIWHTADGGSNWVPQTSGTPLALQSVYFIDHNNGFCVGQYNVFLKTTNGGMLWTRQYVGNGFHYRDVSFANENYGIAVGNGNDYNTHKNGIIARTSNGGIDWHIDANIQNGALYSISFKHFNNATAVGHSGRIMKSQDQGTTWYPKFSGTIWNLNDISFPDTSIGNVVGDNGTILRTTNNGVEWVTQNSGTAKNLYGVSFNSELVGIAVGDNGTILTTSNGGEDWVQSTSGTTNDLRSVAMRSSTKATAVGKGGTILSTSNGGLIWYPEISGTGKDLNGVSFSNLNHGIAVGLNGTILSTTDGGTNWITRLTGLMQLYDVSLFDSNYGIAVGFNGIIMRTEDGGFNWDTVANMTGRHLFSISHFDKNNAVAVGTHFTYQLEGVIIKTEDGGVTWTEELSGTHDSLKAVAFTHLDQWKAVGQGGAIIKYIKPPSTRISGFIRGPDNIAFSGVTIQFSNGGGTATTNSNGYYSWMAPYGWSGTATPSYGVGWSFIPESRTYSNVVSPHINQNYTIIPPPRIISGYVRTADFTSVGGVTITFSNEGGTTVTMINSGFYTKMVPFGWSGTAIPSYSEGWSFIPESRTYSNVVNNLAGEDYTAIPPSTVISGYVRTSEQIAVSGVAITFSNGVGTTMTDSNGYYNKMVPYGWSGTATPNSAIWSFIPESRTYDNVVSNITEQDYTAIQMTREISGYVRKSNNTGVGGVTITFSNGGGTTVTMNNTGNYTKLVPSGWSGTAIPSYTAGWSFIPESRTYTNVVTNQTGQNYMATPPLVLMQIDTSQLDFGNVTVLQIGIDTIIIKNETNSTGNLTGEMTIIGNNFGIIEGATFNISPGVEHIIPIWFSPDEQGSFNATASLQHNAINYSSSLSIQLFGQGVETSGIDDLKLLKGVPDNYNLMNNSPNPFNPSTKIEFSIPEESVGSLIVYDILGNLVDILFDNETLAPGRYSFSFNAANLTSGIYFYELLAKSYVSNEIFRAVKKMSLIK